jgi:hypothetical protein
VLTSIKSKQTLPASYTFITASTQLPYTRAYQQQD